MENQKRDLSSSANWNELYDGTKEPDFQDIKKFINNPLWENLNVFIEKTYNISPLLSYSCCSAQPRMEC